MHGRRPGAAGPAWSPGGRAPESSVRPARSSGTSPDTGRPGGRGPARCPGVGLPDGEEIGIGEGGEARGRRETDEFEHGAAVHEFVLPYAEHSWLQDRPGGYPAGRAATPPRQAWRSACSPPRWERAPAKGWAAPPIAQRLGIDPEEQAQQLPVPRARALLAPLPLRHHVGVDPDTLVPAQPGRDARPGRRRPAASSRALRVIPSSAVACWSSLIASFGMRLAVSSFEPSRRTWTARQAGLANGLVRG